MIGRTNATNCKKMCVKKDVNFYAPNKDDLSHYDLVASYTIAEAQNLTALPSIPAINGLTAQSWNRTISQINALTTKCDIGAIYKTTSGKTEIDRTLTTITGLTVYTIIQKTGSGTMTYTWGDNTTDVITTTGKITLTHTYSAVGNYNETIDFNGTYQFTYYTSGTNSFSQTVGVIDYTVTAIRCSEYVNGFGNNSFQNCYSLKYITIPNSVTSISGYCFQNCSALRYLIIPSGVTFIGGSSFKDCSGLEKIIISPALSGTGFYTFQYCYGLKELFFICEEDNISNSAFYNCFNIEEVELPSILTTIADMAFQSCKSLKKIKFPAGLTSIGQSAFYNCTSCVEYDFSDCTAVPALANSNAFSLINAICVIKVPTALYSTWSSAPNWSTYANYMKAV